MRNYKEGARKLKAHGVIVMDTVMNFDTKKKTQIIPGKNQTLVNFLLYEMSISRWKKT